MLSDYFNAGNSRLFNIFIFISFICIVIYFVYEIVIKWHSNSKNSVKTNGEVINIVGDMNYDEWIEVEIKFTYKNSIFYLIQKYYSNYPKLGDNIDVIIRNDDPFDSIIKENLSYSTFTGIFSIIMIIYFATKGNSFSSIFDIL